MPDEELLTLAGRGQLRQNLAAQVKRMLADGRSEKMVQNFTGQWLQTRDVEGISMDARTVLARDSGQERQLHERQAALRALFDQKSTDKAAEAKASEERRALAKDLFRKPRIELDTELREAMRRETEMFVSSVVQEDPACHGID